MSTTWGDLRAGDVILDKTDVPWTVGEPHVLIDRGEIRVTIRNEAGRSVPVVKPASEPVTLAPVTPLEDLPDKELSEALTVLHDAFGDDKVELIASETTEEREFRENATNLELPPIDHPATLRSHLYLVHDFYVADVDSTLALREHHKKQHEDFPDQGTPHTHEEAT